MKKIAVVLAVVALIAFGATAAMAGISFTKHNLSSTGSGTYKASAGQQNDEICVWCHTPHGANTSFNAVPLWNKATTTTLGYTMYSSAVTSHTAPDASPNGGSMACLSCHDGVNGINSLINQAGQGGYDAAGTNVAFNTVAAGTPLALLAQDLGSYTNIGRDLTNDHPISVVYNQSSTAITPVFRLRNVTTTPANWGTMRILDVLRNDRVECVSCHEPHLAYGDTLFSATAGTMFLRVNNTGSQLCLGCHDI